MQTLNPSEISELIKTRIEKVKLAAEARNEGTVTSVSDGIVRIHGLADVMQGEMIELPNNTFALALNLERDSVGSVVLGDYKSIREGDVAKTTAQTQKHPKNRPDKLVLRKPQPKMRLSPAFHPEVAHHSKDDPRHPTKSCRPEHEQFRARRPPELSDVGNNSNGKYQQDKPPRSSHELNTAPQITQPDHVKNEMQHREVEKDGRHWPPDLPAGHRGLEIWRAKNRDVTCLRRTDNDWRLNVQGIPEAGLLIVASGRNQPLCVRTCVPVGAAEHD